MMLRLASCRETWWPPAADAFAPKNWQIPRAEASQTARWNAAHPVMVKKVGEKTWAVTCCNRFMIDLYLNQDRRKHQKRRHHFFHAVSRWPSFNQGLRAVHAAPSRIWPPGGHGTKVWGPKLRQQSVHEKLHPFPLSFRFMYVYYIYICIACIFDICLCFSLHFGWRKTSRNGHLKLSKTSRTTGSKGIGSSLRLAARFGRAAGGSFNRSPGVVLQMGAMDS